MYINQTLKYIIENQNLRYLEYTSVPVTITMLFKNRLNVPSWMSDRCHAT